MEKLSAKRVQEIVAGMADRLSDYIADAMLIPSKFECYECGRWGNEYFVCGCYNSSRVCEYKKCPQCGDWVDVGEEPVWYCCLTDKIVGESEIEDRYKQKFSEFLHKIFKKAKTNRPINRDIDEQMVDVICSYYEDEAKVKLMADFINGLTKTV